MTVVDLLLPLTFPWFYLRTILQVSKRTYYDNFNKKEKTYTDLTHEPDIVFLEGVRRDW